MEVEIWQQTVVPDDVQTCSKVMSAGNTQVCKSVCAIGRQLLIASVGRYITTMVHKKKNNKKTVLCNMMIAVLCEDKEVTRREWCKEWLNKQSERRSNATILQELRIGYESDFTNYIRTWAVSGTPLGDRF